MRKKKSRARKSPAREKSGSENNKYYGIGGWLVPIVIILFYSLATSLYLLIQRLVLIFTKLAAPGVYVSSVLLIFYCFFLILTILLTFYLNKKSVKFFIITMSIGIVFQIWFFFIGPSVSGTLDYVGFASGIISFLVSLLITLLILFYLLKSKRVKNTFR